MYMEGCGTVVQCRVVVVVQSTWWRPSQGTGLSDSLGGGRSGGCFCHTPLGNSVGGRVLCHIVCSQCCKLAQEAYSGVRDKSRGVSVQRGRWDKWARDTHIAERQREWKMGKGCGMREKEQEDNRLLSAYTQTQCMHYIIWYLNDKTRKADKITLFSSNNNKEEARANFLQ